jgi:hypothetical protein
LFKTLRTAVTVYMDCVEDLVTPLHQQLEKLEKNPKKEVVYNERCDFVDLLLRFYLFQ